MNLPEFENPPVNEVVCGVLMRPLPLRAAHIGLLWQKYVNEYPGLQEVPSLAPIVERFGNRPVPPELNFSDIPPLPRTWFVRRDGTGIIQIQPDRFLHNWRKVRDGEEYPRYEKVIKLFRERLSALKEFIAESRLDSLEVRQLEMTYINNLPKGAGWENFGELASVFPDFAWKVEEHRFLQAPESLNWNTTFVLPNEEGRLHASIRSVKRDESTLVIRFELTVRGLPSDTSEDGIWAWFDQAHAWIVKSFTDLTAPAMHELWKRHK